MNMIISATLSITAIGAVCAVLLCVASKLMAVETDERVERILECLPGSNCGACGFPGCAGYAEALVRSPETAKNLCAAGGASAAAFLSELLGGESGEVTPKIAAIACRGDISAQARSAQYTGIRTCAAAHEMYGGGAACAFGCVGFGDCLAACPSGAICVENGLARVNPQLCTGCGLCAKACPRKLISVVARSVETVVACSNRERGADARKKCAHACLACGRCVRECPAEAITMTDNLAHIDPEKCNGCGHCVEICPAKSIVAPQGVKTKV